MTLSRESDIDWQGCKAASQKVLEHLQKLNVTKVLCLVKIHRALQRYQELLTQYSKSDTTTGLRTAVTNLLQFLPKYESRSRAEEIQAWEESHVVDVILQRLQLFAILMARVFAHCAALNKNVTL
ncbi:interleukin-23 subunit alpha [Crotalus adamanteus]|uniref:Interleukin-23 subunit alpha n=1 Tax=Crotalus adamanteus TaxID=8729 RepID=A0AAW1BYH4_CROAD